MRFTLGDLLAQEALGLELVAGGSDAVDDVEIDGAHPIEIEEPWRWLPPGWLMLTTGLRLRGSAEVQRRLVAELHEHGQAGLCWGVGLVVQQVPRAVIEEADRLGLPVVTVPTHVPFRDVIAYVNGALVSDDLYVMRRVVSMQDYVVDALAAPDPVAAIVERLGGMLEADVLLFDPDGHTLARHGRIDATAVAGLVSPSLADIFEAELDGRQTLLAAVFNAGRRIGWLAIALADRPFADQLARPLLRSAVRLLGLLDVLDRQESSRGRTRRAEVLAAVLAAPDAELSSASIREAHTIGVDPARPIHGVAWVAGEVPESTLADVEATLERGGLPFLLGVSDGGVVGALQGTVDEVLAGAEDAGPPVGVGRPAPTLAGLAASVVEARVVLRHAIAAGRTAMSFDELDPAGWLLASHAVGDAAERTRRLLDPLRAHPRLLETLARYFDEDLDVAAAAASLAIHRNTLRYRLRRIESLLDLRLAAPAGIANVHLALLAEQLAEPSRLSASGPAVPGP